MSTFNFDYEYGLYLSDVGLEKKKMDKHTVAKRSGPSRQELVPR